MTCYDESPPYASAMRSVSPWSSKAKVGPSGAGQSASVPSAATVQQRISDEHPMTGSGASGAVQAESPMRPAASVTIVEENEAAETVQLVEGVEA